MPVIVTGAPSNDWPARTKWNRQTFVDWGKVLPNVYWSRESNMFRYYNEEKPLAKFNVDPRPPYATCHAKSQSTARKAI